MTSSVAAVAGPALDDELYDVRRDLVYSRPRCRGWLHLLCFEISLVIGTLLIATAQGARQTVAAAVYAGRSAGCSG
jgi:hemolysin III